MPSLLIGRGHFSFLGCLVYFFILFLLLIEIPVCKQCRPWADAAFCGIWSGSIHYLPRSENWTFKALLRHCVIASVSTGILSILHFNPNFSSHVLECSTPDWLSIWSVIFVAVHTRWYYLFYGRHCDVIIDILFTLFPFRHHVWSTLGVENLFCPTLFSWLQIIS